MKPHKENNENINFQKGDVVCLISDAFTNKGKATAMTVERVNEDDTIDVVYVTNTKGVVERTTLPKQVLSIFPEKEENEILDKSKK